MNLYQLFQDLIPKATLTIAVVQAEFTDDGTTACLTLDGQPIRVRGVGSPARVYGEKVFISIDPRLGSYITGNAPNLTAHNIEIY